MNATRRRSDAEDRFDGGAVDERAGKSREFRADVVDMTEPAGGGGHEGYYTTLVRTGAKSHFPPYIFTYDKGYYRKGKELQWHHGLSACTLCGAVLFALSGVSLRPADRFRCL
jgi:hypothetical protein